MSYSCKILLDSISETGKRLTTFEITFPRIVLAEFNTHRMFSRNSASSRAIPFSKQLERVNTNPFIPEQFPINGKGMQPESYITKNDLGYEELEERWLEARDSAIHEAKVLQETNIHKQIVNRLLEPFQWHTVIITATEFDNFFKLRTNENAQYEIKRIADLMYEAYHIRELLSNGADISKELRGINYPEIQKLKIGEWHCPLANDNETTQEIINFLATFKRVTFDGNKLVNSMPEVSSDHEKTITYFRKQISVARCARVSYLTHDGKRDIEKDLELFKRLRTSGHWSPFEHVGTPYYDYDVAGRVLQKRSGNFLGWKQYRKEFQDENCTNFRKEN